MCQPCLMIAVAVVVLGVQGCESGPSQSADSITSASTSATTPSLNPDWKTRDRLLGISVDWTDRSNFGTHRIDEISLDTIEALVAANFISLGDKQNAAPSVEEILLFLRATPQSFAFGYAVSPNRPDYRVSLDGIAVPPDAVTPQVRKAAEALCSRADDVDFRLGGVYCWWD